MRQLALWHHIMAKRRVMNNASISSKWRWQLIAKANGQLWRSMPASPAAGHKHNFFINSLESWHRESNNGMASIYVAIAWQSALIALARLSPSALPALDGTRK